MSYAAATVRWRQLLRASWWFYSAVVTCERASFNRFLSFIYQRLKEPQTSSSDRLRHMTNRQCVPFRPKRRCFA